MTKAFFLQVCRGIIEFDADTSHNKVVAYY